MAENVRFALEKEEKLQEEVLLEDKDFIVDLVEVVSFLWTVMDSNLSNILTCCVRFALLSMGRVYTKYRNFFHVSMKRLCLRALLFAFLY